MKLTNRINRVVEGALNIAGGVILASAIVSVVGLFMLYGRRNLHKEEESRRDHHR